MKHVFLIVLAIILLSEIAISFNSALLPHLETGFAISHHVAQMTVAAGLFSLGLAGLVYGAISDCIGRKPIYIFSTILFCLMSWLCAHAETFNQFLSARFLQGFGSGAGWIIGNACLSDLYQGKCFEKVMNKLHAAAGITFAAAPIIGSLLAVQYSWRSCFNFLFWLSAILTLIIVYFQPETLKLKRKLSWEYFINTHKELLRNKEYMIYLFIKVAVVSMLFCELSHLPIVLVDYLQVPSAHYGWYLLPCILVYIAAAALSSKLSINTDLVLLYGFVSLILGNLPLVFYNSNPILVQVFNSFTFLGWGLIFGNATAKLIAASNAQAGVASSFMITCEMIISAIAIYALGFLFHGTIAVTASFICVTSAFIIGIVWYKLANSN